MTQNKKRKFNRYLLTMTSLLVMWGLVFCFKSNSFVERVFAEELTEAEKEEIEKEEEHLEDKMDELKEEAKDVEKEKAEKEQKKLLITNELGVIKSNISVIEGEIKETKQDIEKTEIGIEEATEAIRDSKKKMAGVLRGIDRFDTDIQMWAIQKKGGLNSYFTAIDGLNGLEENLLALVEDTKKKKNDLEDQEKRQQQTIEVHNSQKQTLEYQKNRKGWLLNQTQSEINKDSAEIGSIQSKISNLKGQLSKLLGEGYDTDDIKDAVKFASKKTGVRRDFLMGELVVETDLGRFTGGCTYKNTRMREADKNEFKKIVKELGYSKNDKKISCSPGYGYGGAMGVAQFMPTTWIGYKADIAAKTGNYPPDPWSLTDGVVGMALKIKRDGGDHKSGERLAAKRYYCGGPNSPYWKNKCEDYASKVLYWAKNYEKVLN